MNRIFTLSLPLIFALIACASNMEQSDVPIAQVTSYPTLASVDDFLANTKVNDSCLPPIEIQTYTLPESSLPPTPRAEVYPIGWQEISLIPKEFKGATAYIHFKRTVSEYDELWISINSGDKLSNLDDTYFIYRTETQEWKRILTPPSSGVLLGPGNTIWSVNYTREESVPRFYRLDEKINQYIPVNDKDGLLQKGNIASPFKMDSAGVLWFLFRGIDGVSASQLSLHSFNPLTREAKRHSIGVGFDNFVIDKDDNIYLLQNGSQLLKYSTKTGDIHSVDMPSGNVHDGTSLFIDHKGRLWISNIARFDEAVASPEIGRVTLIPRSPIFIRFFDAQGRYAWFSPKIDVESWDGRLWYDGQAWFDPVTEEWCLFTTYTSRIVEDSSRNLWMIISDALYRYTFP